MPPSSSSLPGERAPGGSRAHRALLLGLLVLGPPLDARAAEPLVVILVAGAERQALAGTPIVARCPEGGRWEATADESGVAVIADVPACALSVDAVPGKPDARFRIERPDGRVVAAVRPSIDRLATELGMTAPTIR